MAAGGVAITVTAAELGAVKRRLGEVTRAMAAPRSLMNAIGAVLESSSRKRFRTNQAPDGTAWKPSIRANEEGGRTLFDKGHLSASITHEADDHAVQVGTNLIYALIHQIGGIITAKGGGMLKFEIPGIGWRQVPQVTIPARPYLGVSESDRTEIEAQIEHFAEGLGTA
jgi:phage virion morphogenesis protein